MSSLDNDLNNIIFIESLPTRHGKMSEEKQPFGPYNWLKEAEIYNKKHEKISYDWLADNADVIILLFTAKGIDRDGIIRKFYEIYENAKHANLPIEVINIPMDESEEDMEQCFEEQANWFTLKVYDPLVLTLKYMYGITCIPHLYVIKIDGSVISTHGIFDVEQYGKNALITWMSTSSSTKTHRRMSEDTSYYGDTWRYMNLGQSAKPDRYAKTHPTVSASETGNKS